MRKILFLFLFLLYSIPAVAAGPYYANAATGSDSNSGAIGSPFLTIQKCVTSLAPGEICYLRDAAVFDEHIENGYAMANGIDLTHHTQLLGYPGERPIIRPTSGQTAMNTGTYMGAIQYRTYGNMVWDCINSIHVIPRIPSSECAGIGGYDLTFDDLEIMHGSASNLLGVCYLCHFLNLDLHDSKGYSDNGTNGGCLTVNCGTPGDHGLYMAGTDNIVRGGRFYNNWGAGIQWLHYGGADEDRNTIDGVEAYNNSIGATGSGGLQAVIVGSGHGNGIINSLVHDNPGDGIYIGFQCNNCFAYNNTAYNNGGYNLSIGTVNNSIVRNNILYAGGLGDYYDTYNLGTVADHNLTGTDPMFVDTVDFELGASSPAIHNGVDLTSLGIVGLTSDKNGNSRPNGAVWDQGAKQFAGSCTPSKVVFTSQPGNAVTGATLGTISVAIQNSSSVTCATATNTVTLTEAGGSTWGTLNSTGGLAKAVVSGTYDWTDLYVTGATGSGSIVASASGLTSATSNSITISAPPSNCTGAGHITQCTKYVDDTGVADSSITTPNLGSSVTVGHTIVVTATVGCKDSGCTVTTSNPVSSVTDSKSNTYTQCGTGSATNLLNQIQTFYAPVVTGGSTFNVTVNWTNSNYYILVTVNDVDNIDPVSPCDVSVTAHDVVAPETITAAAQSIDDDEFVYVLGTGPSPLTVQPPFANLNNAPNRADGWRNATFPTIESANFDIGGDGYWTMYLTSFRTTGTPILRPILPYASTPVGSTAIDVDIVGSHTHFVNSTSTCDFGSGVTTNSTIVSNYTHLTCNITVAVGATVGVRDVTIVTGGETVVGDDLYTIGPVDNPASNINLSKIRVRERSR